MRCRAGFSGCHSSPLSRELISPGHQAQGETGASSSWGRELTVRLRRFGGPHGFLNPFPSEAAAALARPPACPRLPRGFSPRRGGRLCCALMAARARGLRALPCSTPSWGRGWCSVGACSTCLPPSQAPRASEPFRSSSGQGHVAQHPGFSLSQIPRAVPCPSRLHFPPRPGKSSKRRCTSQAGRAACTGANCSQRRCVDPLQPAAFWRAGR